MSGFVTDGEIAFGVITAGLAVIATVISILSYLASKRSADAAERSAAEAVRSNELALRTAERQRFIWWIDMVPGRSSGFVTYVLHNDGTDDAEDVVLTPGPVDPGMAPVDFRNLPNGVTLHAHEVHEFYCDQGLAEVFPRHMMLSWRGQAARPITLPSV